MADLPATIYVQDSGDKRSGLVINRTPEGTLQQKMRDAGRVVGVYELKRLVSVSVTIPDPEVTIADIPVPTTTPATPAATETPGSGSNQQ